MSTARLVYVASRVLTLPPVGTGVYHEPGRVTFPTYVPDPDNPGFCLPIPVGEERNRTRCGRTIYTITNEPRFVSESNRTGYYHRSSMTALRLDVARAIARPCVTCQQRMWRVR